ncbi:hypothetical protein C6988_09770 [Nitrosopumilus sp. b1]|nr:hypothetical protein C6988_09770 [Nitrosopumilus sp. b1]
MAKRDSNGDALFITSLRFDDDSFLKRTIPKERTDVPITQALLKNESIFKEKVDYRGVPVLSATKYIEQMDWGLAVKIDRSEAFATLEYIGKITIFSLVLLYSSFVVMSILISNSFVSRLAKLSSHTNQIAKGKLAPAVSNMGDDEIGNLGKNISEMGQSIRKYQNEIVQNAKLTAIGEFAAKMAHDLRNPLGVIAGDLGFIKMEDRDVTNEKKQAYERIDRSIARIDAQINDILNFVRDTPLNKRNHMLKPIINDVIDNIIIPDDVTVSILVGDVKIFCDKEKISQVFENIITNSIQAMEERGKITVDARDSKDKTTICFTDTGPGINSRDIGKIFDLMYTTKKKGTGLGLAICKKIVGQHNGEISVKNNPTTFEISLPK